MTRYDGNSRAFVSKSTMDCCLAVWHRVGGRLFTWMDVKDLMRGPSQLRSMKNRGFVKEVGRAQTGARHPPKVWQMTDLVMSLVDAQEVTA